MFAFAAGAMIFVVVEEVIPEAQRSGETNITTMAAMFGLAIMFPWGVYHYKNHQISGRLQEVC